MAENMKKDKDRGTTAAVKRTVINQRLILSLAR
jgi:hypothetical protein